MQRQFPVETIEVEHEITYNFYVKFLVEVEYIDVGIGVYEWHGYTANHQEYTTSTKSITWDKSIYTEAQNNLINNYMINHYEEISSEGEEQYDGTEEEG
jgi:hypothetical protein